MTVLDAYALIAVLADEAPRPEVEPLLRQRGDPARITATNLSELYDRFIRLRGFDRPQVDLAIDPMLRARTLAIIAVDDSLARRAGEIRARHYHRERRPVSHADCVAAAAAEALADRLATSDHHLAAMARELGIEVVALPDSEGRRS